MRDLQTLTITAIPEDADGEVLAAVADFYDRALLQAIGNASLLFFHGTTSTSAAPEAVAKAKSVARALTEDRFGVRLMLPGDGV